MKGRQVVSMQTSHKRVVIIGGSFGGINAAYELRRKLRDQVEITVISRDPEFTFLPSLPWVILGWRNPASIQVPLEGTLTRRGIRFIHGEVTELDTDKCEARIASAKFPYDILLIASGADLDYAAIPGLGPADGYTQSTFTIGEAVRARDTLAQVLASDQGRVVIGAAPGASCIGPAYEIAMMIDTVLRQAHKRHRFTIRFITPEPFYHRGFINDDDIGHGKNPAQDRARLRAIRAKHPMKGLRWMTRNFSQPLGRSSGGRGESHPIPGLLEHVEQSFDRSGLAGPRRAGKD